MALTSTQYNMNDVRHVARGSRTGTRTAADFSITLGFTPAYVKVTNLTDRVSAEYIVDADAAKQLVTAADGTRSYEDGGITVEDGVVSVAVATVGLETDNDEVVWEAHG